MIAGREIRTGCADRHRILMTAMQLERAGEADGRQPVCVRGDESWRALLRAADWHRVRPSLERWCASICGAPAWVTDALALAASHDAAQRLVVGHTSRLALATLSDRGIEAMVLKGAALVEAVYPDDVPRDMADIDLLVREDEVDAATTALTASGFRAAWRDPRVRDHHHEPGMMDPAGLIAVEIHRRPLDDRDRTGYPPAGMWVRSRPSANGTHLLPAPEDLLVHVCLHFLSGRRVRSEGALGQVRDIAWIAERGGIDWRRLESLAAEIGVAERVAMVLRTVQLCGQLPAWPLSWLHDEAFATAEVFATSRVLVDWPRPPIGIWVADRSGVMTALRWGGKSAGDLSRRSRPGKHDRRWTAVGRTAACLARAVIREPITLAREPSIERQLRALT